MNLSYINYFVVVYSVTYLESFQKGMSCFCILEFIVTQTKVQNHIKNNSQHRILSLRTEIITIKGTTLYLIPCLNNNSTTPRYIQLLGRLHSTLCQSTITLLFILSIKKFKLTFQTHLYNTIYFMVCHYDIYYKKTRSLPNVNGTKTRMLLISNNQFFNPSIKANKGILNTYAKLLFKLKCSRLWIRQSSYS